MKKYHYIYKIMNNIDGKYYIGARSSILPPEEDNYWGSGNNIKAAIKKYGKENFTKIILENFENSEDKYKREFEIVNEQILNDPMCYNIIEGGSGGSNIKTRGMVTVLDKDGNKFRTKIDDPKYINGELEFINKHKISVRTSSGEIIQIDKNDPRYISGELKHIHYHTVTVRDNEGRCYKIDSDLYKKSYFQSIIKNKVAVKDKDGNTMMVSKDDPRVKSGELVGVTKGIVYVKDKITNKLIAINKKIFENNKHRYIHNTKNKVAVKDKDGNNLQVSKDDPRYLSGELVGVTKGMVLVNDNGKNIYISKDDPRYISGELISTAKGKGKGLVLCFDKDTGEIKKNT